MFWRGTGCHSGHSLLPGSLRECLFLFPSCPLSICAGTDGAFCNWTLIVSGLTVSSKLLFVAPWRDLGVSVQGPNSNVFRIRHT